MKNEKKYLTEDIYCMDNFFPEKMIDTVSDDLMGACWTMQISNHLKPDSTFFWSTFLDESFCGFNDNYRDVLNFIENNLVDRKILRVYANGQTLTQHGDFHTDDGERTYLIGLRKNWNMDSGGATEFIINEKDFTTISAYPKYNRIVSFPANIKHRALPNFLKNDFRITLAIKTEIKNKENIVKNSKINFI
jgi:hypothetical protein